MPKISPPQYHKSTMPTPHNHHNNPPLATVKISTEFPDILPHKIFQYLHSDLTTPYHAPPFLVQDLLHLFHQAPNPRFQKTLEPHRTFQNQYKIKVLYPLLQHHSPQQLYQILISKNPSERRAFIPFLTKWLNRKILNLLPPSPPPQNIEKLKQYLQPYLRQFSPNQLLSPKDLQTLPYIQSENDQLLLQQHRKILNLLPHASKFQPPFPPLRKLQKNNSPLSPPSTLGGISQLAPRGSIEHLHHLLPSELALMEDSYPDYFDLHLLENQLLYFNRDRSYQTIPFQSLHFLLLQPSKLQTPTRHLKGNWIHFLLTLIFHLFSTLHQTFPHCRFHLTILENQPLPTPINQYLQILQKYYRKNFSIHIQNIQEPSLQPPLQKIQNQPSQHLCLIKNKSQSPTPNHHFPLTLEVQSQNTLPPFPCQNPPQAIQSFLKQNSLSSKNVEIKSNEHLHWIYLLPPSPTCLTQTKHRSHQKWQQLLRQLNRHTLPHQIRKKLAQHNIHLPPKPPLRTLQPSELWEIQHSPPLLLRSNPFSLTYEIHLSLHPTPELINQLHQGTLPQNLKTLFQSKNIPLTPNYLLLQEKKQWKLIHQPYSYSIYLEHNHLQINPNPTYYKILVKNHQAHVFPEKGVDTIHLYAHNTKRTYLITAHSDKTTFSQLQNSLLQTILQKPTGA